MKAFRLIAASAFFAAIFAVSAFAQTASNKIGLIDTGVFGDEKEGITKFVQALKSLDAEFTPLSNELQTMGTKIQALEKEIKDLQAKASTNVPIDQKTVNAKLEEYDKLTREYKFKQEDAKARYERREAAVLQPLRQDIGAAIQEFTKKNGYVVIIDVSKDNTGMFIGLDVAADVTKQFIAFYNTRPPTTAAVTK
ncbi:MAG: OmpH family outer membrane protein [Acidobacteria bacterium]|nr:OmpH family outer membrane protein [Acidobacteriota bacterium]